MTFDSYLFAGGFVFITMIHLFLWSKKGKKFSNQHQTYLLQIAVILIQLLIAAFFKKEVGDVALFSGAGWHLRHKIDFYWVDANHTQYPFFPFLIFLHAGLNLLSEILVIFSFSFYLKIILSGCLLLISHFFIKKKIWQLRFLTSPLIFASIYYHGQIDIILLLFLIAAIQFIQKKQSWGSVIKSSFLFAASIAAKTWSILLLPQIVLKIKSWPKKIAYLASIGLLLLVNIKFYTSIVFGSSLRTVLAALNSPGGPMTIWGVSLFLKPIWTLIQNYRLLIFILVFGLLQLLILLKKKDLNQIALLTIISFYLATPNWGVQYLLWQLPFIFILAANNKLKVEKKILILASLYSFVAYLAVSFNQHSETLKQLAILVGLALYFSFVGWFKKLIQKTSS